MGGMVPPIQETLFAVNPMEKPKKGLRIPPIGLIISISVIRADNARK